MDARDGVGFLLDEEVREDLERTLPQYPRFYIHTVLVINLEVQPSSRLDYASRAHRHTDELSVTRRNEDQVRTSQRWSAADTAGPGYLGVRGR